MILITGASGNVGSEAARLLGAQHQPTRALVRDAAGAPRADVEIVTGDFERPDTLDAAMRGIETVILVSPAIPAQEIAVIASAVRECVRHIIKITSKASDDSPVERRRGQARIEAYLETSGLSYTLLRANAYMQNLLALAPMIKQLGRFVMSAGGQVGMIDTRDVAATAATVAAEATVHAGRTYWLTGPDLITYNDVAKELSDAVGYEIEYRRTTPAEHRAAMVQAGLPETVATSNAQAFGLIAEGNAAWLSDEVAAITGAAPRSLRTFIADHIAAFT
ncbi:NmrA family NAD(P)-binding protein [Streptomyces sp. Agncl-13]|uniref:NmrA family NAD(P)-binding protein n=1 Tax=Streptomyces sp. Agncl-13 TaxID=3400628 RepID=UPI003A8A6163